MSGSARPSLSVVLPADRFETIREVVAALREQGDSESLELVVVTPSEQGLGLPPAATAGFAGARIVELGDRGFSPHRARAAGVRAATAPLVAFGETHSFPEPGWAAALLAAHSGPWAAVGPALRNENPKSAISRANLFIDFGPFVDRTEAGTMPDLPGHNTCYKRQLLLAYGDGLDELVESDTLLHADLRARGYALYLEPAAVARHRNLTGPFWFVERFDHDRIWAVARSRDWPWQRRLLYVVGSPLIPLVRFLRVFRDVRRAGRARDMLMLAALVGGLLAGAAGELAGYAVGRTGGSSARMDDVEINRDAYAGRGRRRSVERASVR
jgi:hypothetical protein